jgi:hypothetical protein
LSRRVDGARRDRGYDNQAVPDSVSHLVHAIETPTSPSNHKQLSAEEWDAAARKVTQWRNLVEHYNRRLQEYKLLRDHVANNIMPKLFLFIKAVATLQAMWRQPLRTIRPKPKVAHVLGLSIRSRERSQPRPLKVWGTGT